MRRLSDNHLAAEYMGGFQTTHRYSAAHSARWWKTETCNLYIYSGFSLHAWTELHSCCVSTNSNLDFVQQQQKAFFSSRRINSITFGKFYTHITCLKLFPTQRIDILLFRAAPDKYLSHRS